MPLEHLLYSHKKLVSSPIKLECFFSVVIPVRNEEKYLAKTLKSLSEQVDCCGKKLDVNQFELIFLVNNSTDNSAEIIRHWGRRRESPIIHLTEKQLPADKSNIGYVRRQLMNEAYLRLSANQYRCGIIATTDSDSEVAPDWIAATMAEVRGGAEAVGGRIFINSSDLQKMNAKARAFHLRDTGYRLMAAEIEACLDFLTHDALPRHHQHFNGSFAVTTTAYERAGGVPDVRFLEDVAFYHALMRKDIPFRHSPRVRVQTSARDVGRTEIGLSSQINEWTLMGQNGAEYLVESAKTMKLRLQARRNLRLLWQNSCRRNVCPRDEIKSLADKLLVSYENLKNELDTPQTFGFLYEKILAEQSEIGEWAAENAPVTVEQAIFDLRQTLEQIRRGKIISFN